jgi:hypothetical protein
MRSHVVGRSCAWSTNMWPSDGSQLKSGIRYEPKQITDRPSRAFRTAVLLVLIRWMFALMMMICNHFSLFTCHVSRFTFPRFTVHFSLFTFHVSLSMVFDGYECCAHMFGAKPTVAIGVLSLRLLLLMLLQLGRLLRRSLVVRTRGRLTKRSPGQPASCPPQESLVHGDGLAFGGRLCATGNAWVSECG